MAKILRRMLRTTVVVANTDDVVSFFSFLIPVRNEVRAKGMMYSFPTDKSVGCVKKARQEKQEQKNHANSSIKIIMVQ